MVDEEIRLRILESAMRFIANAGPDNVITICEKLESYVFNSDKAHTAPDDGEKVHRPRRASETKDVPSNN